MDPNNLSEQQFGFAYWYVTHKLQLKAALTVVLVLLCIGLGGYAIWGFTKLFILDYPAYIAMQRQAGETLVNFGALSTARPIDVRSVQVFAAGAGKFDAVAMVRNPNTGFYATFDYRFAGEGADPTLRPGFLLPGEEKPLVALGIAAQSGFRSARLDIQNLRWRRLDAHAIPDWQAYRSARLALTAEDIALVPATQPGQTTRVTFTAVNGSAYSYWNVRWVVLLYRGQSVAAVNAIDLDSLRSGERRPASVTWFEQIPSVTRAEVRPEVDIIDPASYITPGT